MKIQFGDTGNTPESRAQMIRDLFTEGRTVPAHTDFCMNRGLWTEAENYAAALRQHQAEVRDALGELTAEGIPFAGPTTKKRGKAPIWRQTEFWALEDYQYNFDAYVGRGKSNIEIANKIAIHCVARYGTGPKCVRIVEIQDEPEH
jgi:hypothetical protein